MALPRPARPVAFAVVATGLVLGGCGGDGAATARSTPPTTATTTATTTTTAPGRVVDVAFRGGAVEGPGRVEVRLGERVRLRVTSDVPDEVHLHTYDLRIALAPGATGELSFLADIPGVHEVELEGRHRRLLSLVVQ